MSENKQVNYGELDCLLGNYLATDGVILKTAISLDDMVDDILRLVEKASYKNNQLLISNSNKKPSSSLLEQLKDCIKRQPMSGLLDFQTDEGHLLDVCYRELVSLYGELDDSIIQIKSKDTQIESLTRLVEEMKEALEKINKVDKSVNEMVWTAEQALSSYQQYKEGKE
jgi:hypothetical protein